MAKISNACGHLLVAPDAQAQPSTAGFYHPLSASKSLGLTRSSPYNRGLSPAVLLFPSPIAACIWELVRFYRKHVTAL